ncbi:Hypothetical predicted protein, partial [Paramuricea clavata]
GRICPEEKNHVLQRESGQESDSESVLTSTAAGPETKKRWTDEDPLLGEISQTLEETEKISPKIAPKLANIINKRWLKSSQMSSLKRSKIHVNTFALKIAKASFQKLIQKSGANLTALQRA